MINLSNLRRIISGKEYIAQIDGLRFFAIFFVVWFHILCNFRYNINSNITLPFVDFILDNFALGSSGVLLFFVISGFILALPFIKAMNNNGIINLKNFYMRRLTRLEPPYIIIMTIMLFVFIIIKKFNIIEVFEHYFASIFYLHFLFFPGEEPLLNGVAWSLELEIQFYILTPLLTKIFILNKKTRRFLLVFTIFFFSITCNYYTFKYIILLNHINYFLVGYLLADLYLDNKYNTNLKLKNWIIILLYFLIPITFWKYIGKNLGMLLFISLIFFSYYHIIHGRVKVIFQNKIITTIGGMCYSIYLIHLPIIGFINILFRKLHLFQANIYSFILFLFFNLTIIVILSFLFYIYIERPCMNPIWYKKYFTHLKRLAQ